MQKQRLDQKPERVDMLGVASATRSLKFTSKSGPALNRIDRDSALGGKKMWCLLWKAGGVRKLGGGQGVDGVLTITRRSIKGGLQNLYQIRLRPDWY